MVTRSALLYLSRSGSARHFLTKFKSFNKVTRRFVAGEDIYGAVAAVRDLNRKGMSASFDHLGEAITNAAETKDEIREYQRILDTVSGDEIDANISVKLTQLGLDVDLELCYENTRAIVASAERLGNFVRIDMEDSTRTDATLEIFKRLRGEFENVGIVIQAYLYRSERDVDQMLAIGSRIRLCKGAYKEPPSAAFPKKADVDANFIRLMKKLLGSGIYHGIATHDPEMIAASRRFAQETHVTPDTFEFQMLYGIRRDLQEQLVREGYRMRVYVPYGRQWYPYFMRRLAERPANIWFVIKNLLKG